MLRKRSVIIAWVLSYISILIVPIVISVAMQLKIEKVVENEINNSNSFYLKQVKIYMDGVINDIDKLSTEVAFSSYVQDVSGLQKPLTDADRYKILKCVQEFKGLKISGSSINDFYVYFKNSDIILNDISNLDSKDFYNIFQQNGMYWEYPEWMNILQKYYKGVYLPVSSKGNNNLDKYKTIFYFRSLPLVTQGDISANIVINIDESRLLELGHDIDALNKGRLLIIDRNDNIIADSGKEKLPVQVEYENLTAQNRLQYGLQGNERVIISHIDSEKENWKYVYIMPTSVYWDKLDYTRKLTYLGIILCVFLGSIVMAYLLRKNYAPVQSLIKLLPHSQETALDNESNEFSLIQSIISKTIDDKDEINRKFLAQNDILKSRYIERLLRGNVPKQIIDEALTSFGIEFVSDYFAVMLFYIEDFTGFMDDKNKYDYYESFKLFQFIMTNIVEEIVGRNNLGFVTEVNEDIVCLINFRDENVGRGNAEMEKIALEVEKFIEDNFKVKLTTAISNIHETFVGISQAYNEVVETLEYKLVMGMDEVLFYESISGKLKVDYYYPVEKEQQLINSIKAGDYEKSQSLLDEIFANNSGEKEAALNKPGYLAFNMLGTISRAAHELDICNNYECSEQLNKLEKIIHYKKASMVKDEVLNLIKYFCNFVNSRKTGIGSTVAESVKAYIGKNYADENISISAIADTLFLHPTYVSKLFRDKEDIGILDYINNLRIEKAMVLMKDRKYNLEDIAKSVGYTNVRTFSRAFMKVHGITPGRYRETVL